MSERKVRVRFAPSPTGPLHIGGVRTALYNYLFAKKNNGDFILRIEDTDQTRFVPGTEEYIIESLKWCGIEPNEGIGFGDGEHKPYRQSERKLMYRQYAEQLVKDEHAYYAFDTSEELKEARLRMEKAGGSFAYNAITRQSMKNFLSLPKEDVKKRIDAGEKYVIRIKIPHDEEIYFHDLIRGQVVVQSSEIDDKVLFKSDGMPTYHLANVVDDYLMKITHVIRGEEWLPSAPLHVLLYKYLGWEKEMPQFAHLPLLLRPDGNGKLSKRDGDRLGFPVFPLSGEFPEAKTGKPEKFTGYRETGYFPDALINMLALLGWNPGTEQEIFTIEELIKAFSFEHVHKGGARFNPEKTKWFNQQYLKMKSDDELARKFIPYIYENINFHPNAIDKQKSTNLIVKNNSDEKKLVRIFSNELIPRDIEITTKLTGFNNLYQIIKNEIAVSPYYVHRIRIITKEKEQMLNAVKVKTLYSEGIYIPSDFLKVQPNVVEIETLNPFILHSETSLTLEVNKGEEVQIHFFFEEIPVYKTAFPFDYIKNVCALVKEKATFVSDFWNLSFYIFIAPSEYDNEIIRKKWNEKSKGFFDLLIENFNKLSGFTKTDIDQTIKLTCDNLGIKSGEVMQLLRVFLSGKGSGVDLPGMMELLGRDEVCSRMKKGTTAVSID